MAACIVTLFTALLLASCTDYEYLSGTCYDDMLSAGEDSIDCGGVCPSCVDPLPDTMCTNGIMDGDELGVDCGGSCDVSCPVVPPCSPEVQKLFKKSPSGTIEQTQLYIAHGFQNESIDISPFTNIGFGYIELGDDNNQTFFDLSPLPETVTTVDGWDYAANEAVLTFRYNQGFSVTSSVPGQTIYILPDTVPGQFNVIGCDILLRNDMKLTFNILWRP
jgi:hypothetical protein